MTNAECIQKRIADAVKLSGRPLYPGYAIAVEWHTADIPLSVPDEVVGTWNMDEAWPRMDGTWRVQYVYTRPRAEYCVRLHLKGTIVEVPGTRSYDKIAALAIAHNLNATILGLGKCVKAPFQVCQLENSDG